jgi:two-component system, LytTR family, response regulator LytT
MSKVKVGIVEDEMIIALGISDALKELGYEVSTIANNYTQALQMITDEQPDILLLDIQLSGNKDGIDLALKVKKDFEIPFIFLTANADVATVERAKSAMAYAYLVKPFRKNDLYTSIEVCLHNYAQAQKNQEPQANGNYLKDCLFIKQGQHFHKVKIDDILYLESDNNYVNVYTRNNSKMLVRSSLPDYLDQIGSKQFVRVHRSYAVNINHIDTINSEYLIINKATLPISKAYRDQLLGNLKLG